MSDDTSKLSPRNLSAQIAYRGRGNPPVSHPVSAISNCFPGLEFDFRTIWRRIFVGIVLSENTNYVVDIDDSALEDLRHRRLLKIGEFPVSVQANGPVIPGRDPYVLSTGDNPNAVTFMEWSNSLARILAHQGQAIDCVFTRDPSHTEILPDQTDAPTKTVRLTVRHIFERQTLDGVETIVPVIARDLLRPGELSQGLCSPWQNDYRECACYYWAASRPDYVNVVPDSNGKSNGDQWLQLEDNGTYLPDNRGDGFVTYDDLFTSWQSALRFVIGGRLEPKVPRPRDGDGADT